MSETTTPILCGYSDAEARNAIAGIKHIQEWIHSGDRATDDEIQIAQAGKNICRWLTDYCDELRTSKARLEYRLQSEIEACADLAKENKRLEQECLRLSRERKGLK